MRHASRLLGHLVSARLLCHAVALCLALFPFGTSAAQQRTAVPPGVNSPNSWDKPTDLDNGWGNLPGCIDWVVVGSAGFVADPVVKKECLQDEHAENNAREQVKAEASWVEGGLMTLAAIYQTVHAVQQIVDVGRETMRAFKSLTHGMGTRVPSETLFRVADATDSFNQTSVNVEVMRVSIPATDGRLEKLNALVTRALATSKDGQDASVLLGSQAAGLQLRLAAGSDIEVVGIGAADGTGARVSPGPYQPPLPTEVEGVNGDLITDPGAIDGALDTSDEGPSYYSGGTDGGAPYAAASYSVAAPVSSPMGAPRQPALAPSRAAATNDPTLCAVPADMANNTTSYQQIVVMSQGAQTAAARPLADVATMRSELSAAASADAGFERERDYLSVFWSSAHW